MMAQLYQMIASSKHGSKLLCFFFCHGQRERLRQVLNNTRHEEMKLLTDYNYHTNYNLFIFKANT
jgi:hypothetical protein